MKNGDETPAKRSIPNSCSDLFPARSNFSIPSVFRESLAELRSAATLDHPDILIPAKYHNEAPWLPAQRHLALMPSHKVTKESHAVQCDARTSLFQHTPSTAYHS